MIPNFVMHAAFCIATTGNNNLHLGGAEGPRLHQYQESSEPNGRGEAGGTLPADPGDGTVGVAGDPGAGAGGVAGDPGAGAGGVAGDGAGGVVGDPGDGAGGVAGDPGDGAGGGGTAGGWAGLWTKGELQRLQCGLGCVCLQRRHWWWQCPEEGVVQNQIEVGVVQRPVVTGKKRNKQNKWK